MPILGLLFDLDGTLIDSERAICDAASGAFRRIGVVVPELAVADHLGAPLEELYELFVGDDDADRRRAFVAGYIEEHDKHPDNMPPPLPGVVEGLAALRSAFGARTSVATTKPSVRARSQLDGAGLLQAFQHVQGTDPGMRPKPAPDVVIAACRALGLDPADCVMVGDTPRDVHAARAAGTGGAVVVAYSAARYELALGFGADHVVRSLLDLPMLLARS